MALATHQVQGYFGRFRSGLLPGNREMALKPSAVKLDMVSRTDRFISLKCKSCLRVKVPLVRALKGKSLRISAFKGNAQNDESRGNASGSKSVKKSVKLSYVSSQDGEETSAESPEVHSPLSYTSEADRTIAGYNLFKYWLTLLRAQSRSRVVEEISEGPAPAPMEIMETHIETKKKGRGEILKAVWCYFLGLDATIKIPLLIFVPCFLCVRVMYGAEVVKELTPMWTCGPLIVALYIKMLRGLWALYVFSFKQTVNVVKNVPTVYMVVYRYVAGGKLRELFQACLWNPVLSMKNLDFKIMYRRKMKNLEVWAVENYLDYVESVWPYYCRIIRFLKRANFI